VALKEPVSNTLSLNFQKSSGTIFRLRFEQVLRARSELELNGERLPFLLHLTSRQAEPFTCDAKRIVFNYMRFLSTAAKKDLEDGAKLSWILF
jgi:hypothetical protein